MDQNSLRTAFDAFVDAFARGDGGALFALFDEDCEIFDEDIPFRLTKEAFQRHVGFHVANNERLEWWPKNVSAVVAGTTGVTAGHATFRGKPRDGGFRQRFLIFSMGWTWASDAWRIVQFDLSSIDGHVVGASPG